MQSTLVEGAADNSGQSLNFYLDCITVEICINYKSTPFGSFCARSPLLSVSVTHSWRVECELISDVVDATTRTTVVNYAMREI